MKKIIGILSMAFLVINQSIAQKEMSASEQQKLKQDKEAIKAMEGCYKVTFEFAETFSPDTAYKYHDRKFDWGTEYVKIINETETTISLQHLLIVGGGMVIKHWRQDWIYQNTEFLSFVQDRTWKKITVSPNKAKGTWTQKVYQVDDSPRYEGYGTWVHVDGRHFWESTTDAPLPRREHTKRSDYNVMKRFSHIEITDYGWVLDQDNEKIIRENGNDKLLVQEKGLEKFHSGNYNCKDAVKWWNENEKFWADVRTVWNEVTAASKKGIQLKTKVNDKLLYEQLFEAGSKYSQAKEYNSEGATAEIRKIIQSYLINE
jgi:hypothetical protein